MKISANKIITADNCMRMAWYRYILGIKTAVKAANLAFGSAVDTTCTEYLRAHTMGTPIPNLEDFFREEWGRETDCEIEYSSTQTPDKFSTMGQKMVVAFQEEWEKSRLQVFIMPDGSPALQVKLEHRLNARIELIGYLDLIAMDEEAHIVVLDLKTSAATYDPLFVKQADQLTTYQVLVDGNADKLGIERADSVGFMCLLKKASPVVEAPHIVTRRNSTEVAEFKQKCDWFYNDYNSGRFPKSAKHAYNSPCGMCDFKQLCTNGDEEGLIIPEKAQKKLDLRLVA
jgi:CRISPR/Cas system-associated exonuclease Cas4 (RecB family)